MKVFFKKLVEDAIIPTYAHEGDSGFDLYSVKDTIIYPGIPRGVPTGLAVVLPKSYTLFDAQPYPLIIQFEMQIRPKSGLALKGLSVFNTPGTIDNGYRGEIVVILQSIADRPIEIHKGDKIAQGVIVPVICAPEVTLEETDTLDETTRGVDGFGSTGYTYKNEGENDGGKDDSGSSLKGIYRSG